MRARQMLIAGQHALPNEPAVVAPLPSGAGSAGEGTLVANFQLTVSVSCDELMMAGNQHNLAGNMMSTALQACSCVVLCCQAES